jgi:lysozyme
MTAEHRRVLQHSVMQHEGLRLKPYTDTTGHLTIGYGRNLDGVGISKSEAASMLATDLMRAEDDCRKAFPWFSALDGLRQAVLVEMSFNLGITKLTAFHNTLRAIQEGRYQSASDHMLKSRWAQQVGQRAETLARRMRTGVE